MMSVPESRAVVGRHDGINGRDNHADRSPAPLAVCGPHTACRARRRSRRKQPRHGSSYRGRDPLLAASGCGPGHPPAMSPSPRAVHPFHPMTAGHATGPKQGRDYRYRRPGRRRLRMGQSRPPGGAERAVLSPSSPPPQRPRPHSLRGAPGSRGGCAPIV